MNKYHTTGNSKSLNTIVLATTILVNSFHPSDSNIELPSLTKQNIYQHDNHGYVTKSLPETFSIKSRSDYNLIQSSFLNHLNQFIEELASKQEELGNDFSSVLFDNIWDLYQS